MVNQRHEVVPGRNLAVGTSRSAKPYRPRVKEEP